MQESSRASAFSGRVVVVFGTQVFSAGFGIINGILLARLLGPEAKGDYYILTVVPATTMVLIQLGLPQAFGFFAARGRTVGIVTKAVVLTLVLSLAAFAGVMVLLPLLQDAILHGIEFGQLLFAFLALPLALSATFTTAIVMGRQAVRWYAAVKITTSIATTVLLLVVLGGLGPSVNGAIAVYLATAAIQAIGLALGATSVSRAVSPPASDSAGVSYRELFGYGLPFYPTNLTAFFQYRFDVYLIAWLIADPSAPLGFYSMAVGLAEIVFFFPNAVSLIFFPHVAGSQREEADRQVAIACRVTLLVTGAVALLLIPGAIMMIWIVLPAFVPSIPPFLVLLPGVVALTAAKVIGGYTTGIGRPGINSVVSISTLAVNIVAGLALIPPFGITGAAAASLISYSSASLLLTIIAARLSRNPLAAFWLPRMSDVRFTVAATVPLLRRVRDGTRRHRDGFGA